MTDDPGMHINIKQVTVLIPLAIYQILIVIIKFNLERFFILFPAERFVAYQFDFLCINVELQTAKASPIFWVYSSAPSSFSHKY